MKENNELIAKFMGAEFINDAPIEFPKGYYVWPAGDWSSIEELQYNNSWDWLMPVVEKIESLGYDIKISESDCNIYPKNKNNTFCGGVCGESKIEATYELIVEFVQWYLLPENKSEANAPGNEVNQPVKPE